MLSPYQSAIRFKSLNKTSNEYCPLLHLLTLVTTFQTKQLHNQQDKIRTAYQQLLTSNIDSIATESFEVLIESYDTYLMDTPYGKNLVELLLCKITKTLRPAVTVQLLGILAQEYHHSKHFELEVRALFEAFQIGLLMKKKSYKTFNFGLRACEMSSMKQFQKKSNSLIAALRHQIQSNAQVLLKNISQASKVYGYKFKTKGEKKEVEKQNRKEFLKRVFHRSTSKGRNYSHHVNQRDCVQGRSPHKERGSKKYQKNIIFNNSTVKIVNNQLGESLGIQTPNCMSNSREEQYISESRTLYHSIQSSDIYTKIKSKIKSKSYILPFYVLLYEIYCICALRFNSEVKKKYFRDFKTELKDKLVREFPGRNMEQVLFDIELDKLKIHELRNDAKWTQNPLILSTMHKPDYFIESPSEEVLEIKSHNVSIKHSRQNSLEKPGLIEKPTLIEKPKRVQNSMKKHEKSSSYDMNDFPEDNSKSTVISANNKHRILMGVKMKKSCHELSYTEDKPKEKENSSQKETPGKKDQEESVKQREVKKESEEQEKQDNSIFKRIRSRKVTSRSQHHLSSKKTEHEFERSNKHNMTQKHEQRDPLTNKNERSIKDFSSRNEFGISSRRQLSSKRRSISRRSTNKEEIQGGSVKKIQMKSSSRKKTHNIGEMKGSNVLERLKKSNTNSNANTNRKEKGTLKKKAKQINQERKFVSNHSRFESQHKEPEAPIQNQDQNSGIQETNVHNSNEVEVQVQEVEFQAQESSYIQSESNNIKIVINERSEQSSVVNESKREEQETKEPQYKESRFQKSYEPQQKPVLVEQNTNANNDGSEVPFVRRKHQGKGFRSILFSMRNSEDQEGNQEEPKPQQNSKNEEENCNHEPQLTKGETATTHEAFEPQVIIKQEQEEGKSNPSNELIKSQKDQQLTYEQKEDQIKEIQEVKGSEALLKSYGEIKSQELVKSQGLVKEYVENQLGSRIIEGNAMEIEPKVSNKQVQQNSASKIFVRLEAPKVQQQVSQPFKREYFGQKTELKTCSITKFSQESVVQSQTNVRTTSQKESKQQSQKSTPQSRESANLTQLKVNLSNLYEDVSAKTCNQLYNEVQKLEEAETKIQPITESDRIPNIKLPNLRESCIENEGPLQTIAKQLRKETIFNSTEDEQKNMIDELTQEFLEEIQTEILNNHEFVDRLYTRRNLKTERNQKQSEININLHLRTSRVTANGEQEIINEVKELQLIEREDENAPEDMEIDEAPVVIEKNPKPKMTESTSLAPHKPSKTQSLLDVKELMKDLKPGSKISINSIGFTPSESIISNAPLYSETHTLQLIDPLTQTQIRSKSLLNPTTLEQNINGHQYLDANSKNTILDNPPPSIQDPANMMGFLNLSKNGQNIDLFEDQSKLRPSINSIFQKYTDLIRNSIAYSSGFLGENLNASRKSIIKSESKLKSKSTLTQNKEPEVEPLANLQEQQEHETNMAQSKNKSVKISMIAREETISSERESLSMTVHSHVLKPQIKVTDSFVTLTITHPFEKKTCKIEREFTHPIKIKDYTKGLQARITKFLDSVIAESLGTTHRTSYMSEHASKFKPEKNKKLSFEKIDIPAASLINWSSIVQKVNEINLEPQLINLKTLKIEFKKAQFLTVKVELIDINNQIKAALQVYNIWCQIETISISLKNSSAWLKSTFKLYQFVFKSQEGATRYNMLIKMQPTSGESENMVISDLCMDDRNKILNNLSIVVGYAVKIEKGKSKFFVLSKEIKEFLKML